MDALSRIGSIASLGSLILSRPAQLVQGGVNYPINALQRKGQKPYRANENRKPFDAEIRIDQATCPVEPQQNAVVTLNGADWIVWRIIPSPSGSHWIIECMAPATIGIIPVQRAEVPDGMGGSTLQWQARPADIFYAKIREASTERQLTAQSAEAIGRLQMTYQSHTTPSGFGDDWRVVVDGSSYGIVSITVDDENPAWRNAVLSRESD